jgi:hypothetical protein
MNGARRLFSALAVVFSLAVFVNSQTAVAKQAHHDAKQLVGENRKVDGHHDIDHKGKFTTSVEMKNGKVHALHVRHSERGDIPVKKYRANKKIALSTTAHVVYASMPAGQMEDMGTVYIGYSYIDDNGDEQIYWFPAEMIEDPYTGAVEYVPTN